MATQISITINKKNLDIVFIYDAQTKYYLMTETIYPKNNIGLPRYNAAIQLTVEDTFDIVTGKQIGRASCRERV